MWRWRDGLAGEQAGTRLGYRIKGTALGCCTSDKMVQVQRPRLLILLVATALGACWGTSAASQPISVPGDRRQPYDVILMDMRMPDLDGIETTRRIRQMSQCADVWIIAMTANAMPEDRQRCYAAGMDDFETSQSDAQRSSWPYSAVRRSRVLLLSRRVRVPDRYRG